MQGLEEEMRDEDDHGGRGRRPVQGGESAEQNREVAPAKRDHVRGRSQAETLIRDRGAEELETISPPAAKETGRETEEEKRYDLNERRLNGKLGCKINDECRSGDQMQEDCRKGEFLGTRQDGHRSCHKRMTSLVKDEVTNSSGEGDTSSDIPEQ